MKNEKIRRNKEPRTQEDITTLKKKMNQFESFHGLEFKEVFRIIREDTNDDMQPVIIIRKDDVKSILEMRKYFKNKKFCIYVKLGVACSMDKIYKEIFDQMGCDTCLYRSEHNQTIPVIARKIKGNGDKLVIIVDNCQYLVFSQIFVLLGLMLELTGFAQFFLLLPKDCVQAFEKKNVGYKAKLFFKHVNKSFEVT